eukprot:gene6436-10444_t
MKSVKLVAVGKGGVGKTSFLAVIYDPTIDLRDNYYDNRFKTIKIDGNDIQVSLWDTADDEYLKKNNFDKDNMKEEIVKMRSHHQNVPYFETSSYERINIDEALYSGVSYCSVHNSKNMKTKEKDCVIS